MIHSRFVRLAACTAIVICGTARTEPLPAQQTPVADGGQTNRPNLLLIVADDLGFSDLGCYGSEIETPQLDRLAERGLRLSQFYTTGRCCPSRASILTGYYPHRVGLGHMVRDLDQPGYRGRVSADVPLIAERLRAAGYRTFLSGKWHLGTDDPTERGFEEFFGTLVSAKTFWDADHFLRLPRGRAARTYADNQFYGTTALADYAIDFLTLADDTPEQPWFLYLAFNAPHFPLQAPPDMIAKYAGRYNVGWDVIRDRRLEQMKEMGIVPEATGLTPRSQYFDWEATTGVPNPAWTSLSAARQADLSRRMAIYAAMVDSMDQQIGRVLDELARRRALDNTLIVFTSDNGGCAEWDPFGFDIESGPQNILHRDDQLAQMGSTGTFHSVGSGWANASNAPWRLYKHYNHEGGISAPCILHWPARTNAKSAVGGSVQSTPAHLIDLVPTLLAAAGLEDSARVTDSARATAQPLEQPAAEQPPLPGQSLLPLLESGQLAARTLYFEHEGHRAVRDGDWKLVALRGQPWELYDLRTDRTEMHDLAQKRPDHVQRLSAAWDDWAEQNNVTPLPKDYGVKYVPPLEPVSSTTTKDAS